MNQPVVSMNGKMQSTTNSYSVHAVNNAPAQQGSDPNNKVIIISAQARDPFRVPWTSNTDHLNSPAAFNSRNCLLSKLNTPGSQFFRRQSSLLSSMRGSRLRYDHSSTSSVNGLFSGRDSPLNFESKGLTVEEKYSLNSKAEGVMKVLQRFQCVCRRFLARKRCQRPPMVGRVCPICQSSAARVERVELEKCQKELEFSNSRMNALVDECERNKANMEEVHNEKVTKLQQSISRLEAKLSYSQEKVTTLQAETERLLLELDNKHSEVSTYQDKLTSANEKLSKKLEEIHSLREERLKFEETIKDQQFMLKRQTNIRKTVVDEDLLYKRISELTAENDKFIQENEQLKKTVSQFKVEMGKFQERSDEMNEYVVEIENQNSKLENTVKALKTSLERCRQENEEEVSEVRTLFIKKQRDLQQQLDDEMDSKEKLHRVLRDYERQIKQMQIQKQTSEKDKFKEKNEALREEARVLKQRLSSVQMDFDNFKANNVSDTALKRVTELSAEIEEIYKEKGELEHKVRDLQLNKNKLEFSVKEKENELESFQKEKQILQQKLQNKSKECVILTEQVHSLNEELQNVTQSVLVKIKEIDRLEAENKQLKAEIVDLKAKIETLSADDSLEEASRQLQQIKSDIRTMEKEKNSLCESHQEEVRRLQVEIRQFQAEAEISSNKEVTNQSQIRKLRRQITDMEEEVDGLKKRITENERKREELEEELIKQDDEWRLVYEEQQQYIDSLTMTQMEQWNDEMGPDEVYSDQANQVYESSQSTDTTLRRNYMSQDRSAYSTVQRTSKFDKHEDLLNQVDAALNERRSTFRTPVSTFKRSTSIRELRMNPSSPRRTFSIRALNKN